MSRAISLAHAVLVIRRCSPRSARSAPRALQGIPPWWRPTRRINRPSPIPQMRARLSSASRAAGVGGFVRVIFTVDTAGVPERTTIAIVRSPNPGFDFGIKRAVSTWRYVPARLCGRPVRVRRRHEFEFRPITRRGDTSASTGCSQIRSGANDGREF